MKQVSGPRPRRLFPPGARWLACLVIVLVALGATSSGRTAPERALLPQDQQQVAGGISPQALAEIDALIREKDSRSGAALKMDSQLIYELKMQNGQPIANGINYLETDLPYTWDGRTILDVKAHVTPDLLARVAALGGEVLWSNGESLRVQVLLDHVEALAAHPDVSFVQPRQDAVTTSWKPLRPTLARNRAALASAVSAALQQQPQPNVVFTQTGQGSRSSEGDITHLAYAARAAFQADGTGVKIGVLSDGVANLAASQALGDLGPVTVLPGQTGSGDEGTAMLEIIHDLAPGAQLYFATAFTSLTSFANNIRALRAAGCDIIVDDVFYYVETPFQDGQASSVVSTTNGGVVIQAVNDVTADGAMYFSSAGNSGNLNDGTSGTWEGDFVDGGPTASPLPGGNRLHSFGAQSYNVMTTIGNLVNLYWSDPLGTSSNDYDLFRLNAAGTSVLSSSTNIQNGARDPYEQVSAGTTANARIVIVKKTSAAARYLHLATNRGRLATATAGQIHGHAAAANGFGVGATPAVGPFPSPFNVSNVVETFSSDGPRRLFFQADGTPITPGDFSSTGGTARQKPDITAADGVSVTGVGGFGSPFFGTSAAAPHAAAIAGLLKSANPGLTSAQIRAALIASAIDIEAPGTDRDSGAGIIMVPASMLAAGIVGSPFLDLVSVQATDNPGNGNGAPEAGEGARLTLPLANYGGAPATVISATLTSPTAGITVTTPAVSVYPNLAPGDSSPNPSLLLFTAASNFLCPGSADFTLTVHYAESQAPRVLDFKVPIGPPSFAITKTLDGTAPPSSPGVAGTTGFQTARLFRDGVASGCGAQKATPALSGSGTRMFDAYAFNTCSYSAPTCVTVTLSGTNAINLFSAAYTPSFNPANVQQNYLADAGASSSNRVYSFDLAGGSQAFAVDVHEVSQGGGLGVNYKLTVSGACGGSCEPPNSVPVAKARNVTVSADASCSASASVDDGSYDPDGDPLTITQSPAGPYPLGTTQVLLTVTDPKGATSQATATVTVIDTAPPAVSPVAVSTVSLWPPNHKMVPVTVSYDSPVDNCSAVTCSVAVTSNEPINGLGDGDTSPDWQVVDLHHVLLRAERAGSGNGRVYTITLTCTDAAGNQTVRTATVAVPHSM